MQSSASVVCMNGRVTARVKGARTSGAVERYVQPWMNFVLVLCARFGTGCATFGRAPCGEVTAGQETRYLHQGSHSPTSLSACSCPCP